AIVSRFRIAVSDGPCPPSPFAPWHVAQFSAKTFCPFARSGAAGALAGALAAVAGGTCIIVPFKENNHTLSPRADPANTLPAEYAATYSSPSYSKTLTGAFMPAPV